MEGETVGFYTGDDIDNNTIFIRSIVGSETMEALSYSSSNNRKTSMSDRFSSGIKNSRILNPPSIIDTTCNHGAASRSTSISKIACTALWNYLGSYLTHQNTCAIPS